MEGKMPPPSDLKRWGCAWPLEPCKRQVSMSIFIWLVLPTIYLCSMRYSTEKRKQDLANVKKRSTVMCLEWKHAKQHPNNRGSPTKSKANPVTEIRGSPEYGLDFICHHSKLDITEISLNRALDKQTVVHSHDRLLLYNKEEVGNNVDRSQIHDSISTTVLPKVNCKDRKQISGCHRSGEELGVDSRGDGSILGDDESFFSWLWWWLCVYLFI